jgi:ATP-dependent DNA helicase RecG
LANRDGGGIILFGVDEADGFRVCGVGDPHKLMTDMADLCTHMSPPIRPEFSLLTIDGRAVVAMEIPETRPVMKPCYFQPAGLQKGSYIRVGSTDRVMTDYEVFGYISARSQPTFDETPVLTATLDDLDHNRLLGYIASLRETRPKATYLGGSFEDVLRQLRVIVDDRGCFRPTLAGLLVFGKNPQAFEPQLVITFVQYYGTERDEVAPSGERFLDNRKFEGPISDMVEGAMRHILGAIRKSSLIDGLLRREIPEYPVEALREAIMNAVAHRDYSEFARGSYIQIRLFADRLEVQSPGGLHGSVTIHNLESEQSTRNRILMRMIEDLHMVENRGSGISAMIGAMRRANLAPPEFIDKRSSFWVVFRNHTMMNPDTIDWLNQFASSPINDAQRLCLAYVRTSRQITNGVYQRLNRTDAVTANRELRALVELGLLTQHGSRRWTYYSLPDSRRPDGLGKADAKEHRVLEYVRNAGSITNAECRQLLALDTYQASRLLKRMCCEGMLVAQSGGRWTRYVIP